MKRATFEVSRQDVAFKPQQSIAAVIPFYLLFNWQTPESSRACFLFEARAAGEVRIIGVKLR